jgi:hypothetical protein
MPEILDLTNLTDSSDDENGSESEEIPEPNLDDISLTQLKNAIASVSEQRLREAVSRLVVTIPAAGHALMRELFAVQNQTRKVVSRWETCANCGEEYDAGEPRDEEECTYHSGSRFL